MGCSGSKEGRVVPGGGASRREKMRKTSIAVENAPLADVAGALLEDEYTVDSARVLGKGRWGNVLYGKSKKDEQEVAIKEIKHDVVGAKISRVRNEVAILRKIGSHPYIVSLLKVFQTETCTYLVLEYMGGGNLLEYLTANGALAEPAAIVASRRLLRTLSYLHHSKIMHRDIKPENVLLNRSPTGEIIMKLADFGLARQLAGDKKFMQTICGTLSYSAPEMRPDKIGTGYTSSVDIWAFGIVLYEMLGAYHPFDPTGELPMEEVAKIMRTGVFEFNDPIWSGVSESVRSLIKLMLTLDPAGRPSAKQAHEHPWLAIGEHRGSEVAEPLPEASTTAAGPSGGKRKSGAKRSSRKSHEAAAEMQLLLPTSPADGEPTAAKDAEARAPVATPTHVPVPTPV